MGHWSTAQNTFAVDLPIHRHFESLIWYPGVLTNHKEDSLVGDAFQNLITN